MTQITISDEIYTRAISFKPVVESAMEISLEDTAYVELLLRLSPDLLLAEFLGGADARGLLQLLQQLGQAQPRIYGVIASVLEQSEQKVMEAQKREAMRQQVGFKEPVS